MTIRLFFSALFALCLFTFAQAQIPVCTNLKVTTLPANGDYGGMEQFSVSRQTVANPEPGTPAPVSVFLPTNATATNRLPVIFFAHGFGGLNINITKPFCVSLQATAISWFFHRTRRIYSPTIPLVINNSGAVFKLPLNNTEI